MTIFTIGYDPDFAPITWRDAGGRARGKAIEFLVAACEKAGIDCRFAAIALADHEEALANGDVGALAAMAATAQRRSQYSLSPPFMQTGAAWFAPPLSDQAPFDPATAAEATPVTTPAAGPLLRLIGERWPHLVCIPATSYADALGRVGDGEAVAAALNIDVGRAMCELYAPGVVMLPEEPFMTVELALACPKGRHDDVLKRLSAAIEALKHAPST